MNKEVKITELRINGKKVEIEPIDESDMQICLGTGATGECSGMEAIFNPEFRSDDEADILKVAVFLKSKGSKYDIFKIGNEKTWHISFPESIKNDVWDFLENGGLTMAKIKTLQPIPNEELQQRIKAIGTYREVAEMLGYKKSTLRKIANGENAQAEIFLYKFRELEREIKK